MSGLLSERYSFFSAIWPVIITVSAALAGALVLFVTSLLPAFGQSPSPASTLSPEDLQRLGQRMYREGILPSGETMQSVIKGEIVVLGTSFSCVSCHMRSGLGSVEGGVITTPTNGRSLYNPRKAPTGIRSGMSGGMGQSKSQLPPQPPPGRPVYSDESLASLIRWGVDPSGRAIDHVMPRYLLQDRDMAIMVSYLKSLSSTYSPGVDEHTLRFATVVSEDVAPGLRYEQAAILEKLFARMNQQSADYEMRLKDPKQNRHMSKTGRLLHRNLSLSRWLLKGPPKSWRAQLDEYYRKEPVFALLGGITTGDWKPVHDFSEANRIPCLFPQTDFPVISETGSYTLYLSKGYFQEGEAAARFINRSANSTRVSPVVQIIRETNQGKALSEGFEESWRELGQSPPVTIRLQPGEFISQGALEKLMASNQSATMIVWDGPEALQFLATFAGLKNRPEAVFVSSSYLGKKVTELPDHVRDVTFITYPHRLPQEEEQKEQFYLGTTDKNRSDKAEADRIVKRSFPLNRILIQALSEMKDHFYRDYFLDVISMNRDLDVPLYERLSFGPGQCYASKGCYIVQLSKGENPTFINKSDWVIH
jgi:ABC-type branched-subunit amino acid transport system substrate-binding protein